MSYIEEEEVVVEGCDGYDYGSCDTASEDDTLTDEELEYLIKTGKINSTKKFILIAITALSIYSIVNKIIKAIKGGK